MSTLLTGVMPIFKMANGCVSYSTVTDGTLGQEIAHKK